MHAEKKSRQVVETDSKRGRLKLWKERSFLQKRGGTTRGINEGKVKK